MAKPGKILVTGSRGQLGRDLMRILNESYSVSGLDIEDVDIRDADRLRSVVKSIRPDTVIHAAAYTDVDGCEADQEQAMSINSAGAGNVARTCREIGALMVYYSTDYVFSGHKGEAYVETDRPDPINVYGRSKLAGEEAVRNATDDFIILRISWLYGRYGRNFVKTMLTLGRKWNSSPPGSRQPLTVVDDQHGCPTWAEDVARQTAHLMENDARGLYHVGSLGITTWYRFACDIFDAAGMEVDLRPCTTSEFPRAAARPSWSVLENYELNRSGLNIMRDHKVALREFLSSNLEKLS